VGGRANIFVFLLGEDINTDHVDLGVTVLAYKRSKNRQKANCKNIW
jgi:hypothetical protein